MKPASTGKDVWRLTVERAVTGSTAELRVSGRIGHTGATALDSAIAAAVTDHPAAVVLDLGGVDYVSSAGVRLFDQWAAELASRGGRFSVRNATDPVRLALELAGLDRLNEPGAGSLT